MLCSPGGLPAPAPCTHVPLTLSLPMQVPYWGGAEGHRLPQAVSPGGTCAQVRTPQALSLTLGSWAIYGQGLNRRVPVTDPVSLHRRESQTLSVRGESIPEEQFCQSLCRTLRMWPGARLIDYVCVESSLLGECT